MNAILSFKNFDEEDKENSPCGDDLRERLNAFHEQLLQKVSLLALQEPSDEVTFLIVFVIFLKVEI